jgi:glycosyltransferase involved in cell wall biosynthesis
MKILIITPDLYPFETGYGGRISLSLYDAFIDLGHTVDIISTVPDNARLEMVDRKYNILFIKLYHTNKSRFSYFMPPHLLEIIKLKNFLDKSLKCYDLIILNDFMWTMSFVSLLLIRNKYKDKILLINHGIMYLNNNRISFYISKTINKTIGKIFLGNIGGILSFSQKSDSEFNELLNLSVKRITIPSCLNVKQIYNMYNNSILNKEIVVNKFKDIFNIDNFIFLIGAFNYHKGYHIFLDSVGRILNNGYNFDVVIAGRKDDSYINLLNTIIDKYNIKNKVFFIGEIDDVEKFVLLMKCRLYIIPSLSEGFGVGAEEAMLFGIRTIATDTGAHKDLLGSINYDYIVKPGDSKELENAIIDAMNSTITVTPVLNKTKLEELSCNDLCRKLLAFMFS